MVYVISQDGKPLMPCSNPIVRLLLKQGKAKVKKRCPFTIKLTYETTNYTQDLTLGVDTGSGTVGTAVSDDNGNIVYMSKVVVRNDISDKMTQRAKYRRNRRNRKTRYRKARFLNRKNSIKSNRFSPTMVSKFHSHIKEIEFIKSILPITQLVLETAQFDTHLMKNPSLASPKVKAAMQSAVSLLAGGPSVVYGLVGMLVLVPGIRRIFHVPDGASLLASIIVLAVMILPSIIKMSITALDAVPREYEDASLALGATPIETYFKVSVPAAKSGIAAAVVLGVGRAIGEAMAVMMVAGNAPNMPNSLFQSVRFLTTAVSSEMAYSSGLQREALFSIALVLFLFIMLINATLNFFLKRERE